MAEKKVKAATTKKEKKVVAKAPKTTKKEVKAPKVEAKAASENMPSLEELSKEFVINRFALKSGDTGSPEVQVAILTFKVVKLQSHLTENPKDNHSRRGLLKIVSKRRRILNYLKDKDEARFGMVEDKIKTFQQHYSA